MSCGVLDSAACGAMFGQPRTDGDPNGRLPQDPRSRRPADARAVPRHPAERHRAAGHRRASRQPRARHLRRHRLGRAAVRLVRQVRVRLRLAELHQADRAGQRRRAARRLARHGPHRGALGGTATAISATCSTTARATAAACATASTRRRCASSTATTWRPRATAPTSTRWRTCDEHDERTAVLAGGCFWGMQDLIRKHGRRRLDARRLHRRRRAERDLPQPRHARRGDRDHLRPGAASATASCWSSSSRSTIRRRAIARATTSARATARRSTTPATSRSAVAEDTIADVDASGLWPGKVVTEVAPAGDVLGSRARAPGLPASASRTATPATSCGRTGSCRVGRMWADDGNRAADRQETRAWSVPHHPPCEVPDGIRPTVPSARSRQT